MYGLFQALQNSEVVNSQTNLGPCGDVPLAAAGGVLCGCHILSVWNEYVHGRTHGSTCHLFWMDKPIQ